MPSRRLRQRASWLAAVFAAPVLFAQEPPPAPAPAPAPATVAKPAALVPVAHLRVAGPAQWRARFSPTNIGSLLESESGRALRVRTIAPIEAMLQQLLGLDDGGYAAARARLLDYGGELDVTAWLDPAGADDPIVVLRLGDHGGTDLKTLATDLGELCERAVRGHFVVGTDGTPRVLRLREGGPLLTEPRSNGADFVAVIADEGSLQRALQLLAESTATPQPRQGQMRPPLSLQIDTAALVARQDARGIGDKVWKALGVDTLGQFSLELATAGPHVQLELAHTFTAGDRGLFAVLFPDVQGLPALAALADPNDAGVKVGRVDPQALYQPILALLKDFDGDAAEKQAVRFLGSKDDGFLAQFTGEYLMFGAGEGPDLTGPEPDWGIALRIRDPAAMASLWRTLRKEVGLTELETTDLGGGFQRQRLGGLVELDVVIGKELFAFAHGKEAPARLDALVAAAQKHDWSKPAAPPARLQEVQRFAPPGWNGFGEGDVSTVLAQVGVALQALDEITGSLPELQHLGDFSDEDRAALAQLLTEHHLQTAHSLTGYSGRRWCFRVLW